MASAGEKALHSALKKREFDRTYYFYGDDDFLKDQRVRELIDAAVDPSTRDFNLEIRRGSDLDAEVLDSVLSTPPMLAARRVVVVREVDKLKKDVRRVLDGYLKRPADDTLLVLTSPCGIRGDKALTERSTAVEFAPLSGERVQKWVTFHAESVLGRSITATAVSLLIEAVGEDLSQLAVELEKLTSFSDVTIDEVAVAAVVGIRRGETMGDLLDAVGRRDANAALALIPVILQQPKTSAVSIVMGLSTQTLALAYGNAARGRGTSARALFNEYMSLLRETGAFPGRPWGEAVAAWSDNTEYWNAADLDAALHALLLADEALKETKISSDEQLLTSLVLALCVTGQSRRVA